MHASRSKGLILVIIGASFWGLGGTVSQKLFEDFPIEVNWLVAVRLLVAGLALLALQWGTGGHSQLWRVWRTPATAFAILLFGIGGMLAVQYTYMASIAEGNAAVATLLQYLAPVMIVMYLLLCRQTVFTRQDGWTLLLAMGGCFLLLTNGSFSQLSVPGIAVLWGVLSGVALAFYTLYAGPLLQQFNSLVIVGWAMTIGGGVLSVVHPFWRWDPAGMTLEGYMYLGFVVIFGTMIAFWFYIASLQYLAAQETSLLGCLEPLAAVAATVFWLQEPFGLFQWLGTGCILAMVVLLALAQPISDMSSA